MPNDALPISSLGIGGVKVYSLPRLSCGKQMIDTRDQVGSSVKLGIYWDGSTRHLDVHPPTHEYVKRLGSMYLTCREPYYTYSTFGRPTSQFKLY